MLVEPAVNGARVLQEIVSFIKNFDCLPSPGHLKNYLAAMLSDPQLSLSKAVELVKLDPSSLARILKLANSNTGGSGRSVSSVKNAVSLLGLSKVKSLVSISHLFVSSENGAKQLLSLEKYWKHSLAVAMISESVAKQMLRYDSIDTDGVFAAGLFHDVGKIVLCSAKPELVTKSVVKCRDIPYYETETGEFAHPNVGAMLAESWKFPKDIRTAIQFHHTPTLQSESVYLPSIIHVADVSAQVIGYGTVDDECVNKLDTQAFNHLGIQMEALRVIASSVLNRIKTIESQVELFR